MLAAASVIWVAAAYGAAEAPKKDFETRIDIAIERGVKYLRKQIEKTPWSRSEAKQYKMGRPAIEAYALIKSDVSVYDPVVMKALEYLETLEPKWVYGVSIYLMALDAVLTQLETDMALVRGKPDEQYRLTSGLASKLRKRMSEMADWLVDIRRKGAGVWNYANASKRYDNSNTQFAVLALGVAAKRRLRVPLEVWEEIADHFIKTQEKDGPRVKVDVTFRPPEQEPESRGRTTTGTGRGGKKPPATAEPRDIRARGWNYQGNKGAKLTMTAAGCSSLILARAYLAQSNSYPVAKRLRLNQAIWDGTAWLARNGLKYGGWYYYALYSVEKVGDLGGMEKIGGIDWYRHGAELILGQQRKDGSWSKKDSHDHNRRYQTSFALLFLNRATDLLVHSRPIVLTGKGSSARGREGWVYVGRLRGEVSVRRMFRKLKYNPQRSMLRIGEDMVKDATSLKRGHELIPHLIDMCESPYKRVSSFARRSLERITGERNADLKAYRRWAEVWSFVIAAGRTRDGSAVPRLRKLLRTTDNRPLKDRILWTLEQMRAKEAVGDIIDELEDPNADYRARAYSALKFITFKSLPFSPRSSATIRKEQIAAWRTWYAQNSGE